MWNHSLAVDWAPRRRGTDFLGCPCRLMIPLKSFHWWVKVLQQDPRTITGSLLFLGEAPTAAPPSFFLLSKQPPTSIRKPGVVYYEWGVCGAASPKWSGLIVNGPWWFIVAYAGINILSRFKIIVKLLHRQHITALPLTSVPGTQTW